MYFSENGQKFEVTFRFVFLWYILPLDSSCFIIYLHILRYISKSMENP